MILHHGTIEQSQNNLDIEKISFNSKINLGKLIDYIDNFYCGKQKDRVFVAMIGSESKDFFITSSYLKVEQYFNTKESNTNYFLFEYEDYTSAFEYCIDFCEN